MQNTLELKFSRIEEDIFTHKSIILHSSHLPDTSTKSSMFLSQCFVPQAAVLYQTTDWRDVGIINLDREFSPACSGRRQLFWPGRPLRWPLLGFHKGSGTFPIYCWWITSVFPPNSAEQHNSRLQSISRLNQFFLYQDAPFLGPSPNNCRACPSWQRPPVLLCGCFNWTPVKWVSSS